MRLRPAAPIPDEPARRSPLGRRRRATRAAVAGCALALLTACGGGSFGPPPAAPAPALAVPAGAFAATMVRDVDGDTIIATTGAAGADLRVRIIGIDTPESVKPGEGVACFGHQASAFTKRLIPVGAHLTVAYESEQHDTYGRELWDVWLPDGRSLAAVLAASGVARVDPFPPNVAFAADLAAASRQAQAERLGLWGSCSFATAFPDAARAGYRPDGTRNRSP